MGIILKDFSRGFQKFALFDDLSKDKIENSGKNQTKITTFFK